MSRSIRALVMSAALLASALFGALVVGPALTADAQSPIATPRWRPPVPWEIPQDIEGVHGGVAPPLPWSVPEGSTGGSAGGEDGKDTAEPEEITCSLNGCRVPIRFVDEDGETVKMMVITFEDVEADTTD